VTVHYTASAEQFIHSIPVLEEDVPLQKYRVLRKELYNFGRV
jgi:hypothetical protein